jgi:hypothetical protein
MARHLHSLGTISILNAQTSSAAFVGSSPGQVQAILGALASMVIFAPTTLPETVNLQVAPTATPLSTDWKNLQWQPGTDVLVAAAKAVNIPLAAGYRAIRLTATVAVAAQRDFIVIAQIDADYES